MIRQRFVILAVISMVGLAAWQGWLSRLANASPQENRHEVKVPEAESSVRSEVIDHELVSGERASGKEGFESARYELLVRYAKANMDLAEVDLQQAMKINRKSPGSVPRLTLERLQSNVAVTRKQFEEASLASANGMKQVRLEHAKEKLRLALIQLTKAQEMADEGLVEDLEMKRLSLRYEVAKLNLALIENPDNFITLLQFVESKVQRLSEEVLELDRRLSKVEPPSIQYKP